MPKRRVVNNPLDCTAAQTTRDRSTYNKIGDKQVEKQAKKAEENHPSQISQNDATQDMTDIMQQKIGGDYNENQNRKIGVTQET